MKVKDYKELLVWQKGIEITDKIYLLTQRFPHEETYGLSNQMRRAAVSISANIAEGFARNHTKEYIQFLHIALGSCAELDTYLIISKRRNYGSSSVLDEISSEINIESRMLSSLIKKLATSH